MEKVYGPFNLEEHKYFIRINRDISSPVIKVFELYEGKSKIYECHKKSTHEEIGKLIDFFDEYGGEKFIKRFLADEKTRKIRSDRDYYFELLIPFLFEKWSAHLEESDVKEGNLNFVKWYDPKDHFFLEKYGYNYFMPIAKKFISPEHPLIIFEYVKEHLEHIEDQEPRVKDDGTIVIPSPFYTDKPGYAELRDYESVEALRKKWGWKGNVWNPSMLLARDLILPYDTLEEFKDWVITECGSDLDYLAKESRMTPPDTQYAVFFYTTRLMLPRYFQDEKEGNPEFVVVDGIKYYVDEKDTLDLRGTVIYDITEIEGLQKLTELKVLDLRENLVTDIKGLGYLTNLQILKICCNRIKEIKGLENLTNLRHLDLHTNHIKEIKGLEKLINLEYLDLSHNQITKIKELDYLTNLRHLDLRGNPILEIEGLEYLINIQTLELEIENYMMRVSEEYFVDIASTNPQEVVKYCQDKKDGMIPFVTIDGIKFYIINDILDLSNLREFKGIILTDISEIEGLKNSINLRELYLSENQLTEIKGLETLINLRKLDLSKNQIEEISGLTTLINLVNLDLRDNKITEVKNLGTLKNLRALYLEKNPIKKEENYLISLGRRNTRVVRRYCQEKASKGKKGIFL